MAARPTPAPTHASLPLAHLRPGHPRLLATAADFDRLRTLVRDDADAHRAYTALRNRATKWLEEPPSRYEIPDGKRLLATSRRVLDRVLAFGLLYRLDGDRCWADRAWRELAAAAAFRDWNPSHFLDTAEMSAAFGIGYDWFFDAFTPDQRAVVRQALLDHGLRVGLACYETQPPPAYGWWTRAVNNWNQVCNGGMIVGALAVGDEAPEVAGPLLRHAVASMPLALRHFAPDGAWAEGTGYWAYAMRYTAFAIASLQSATADDAGLRRAPGLDRTGFFPLYMAGPKDWTFNFADCGDKPEHAVREASLFWLAREFHQPALAGYQAGGGASGPLDILWGAGAPRATPPAAGLPLDRLFRGVEAASLRSAWGDTNAWFAAFKAGDNAVSHSHLDIGSFVLDALGQRWILDPGADNYNLPGYFSHEQRWTYYRLRAEGHNTLVLNPGAGPDQPPHARAAIVRARLNGDAPAVVADLTPAYPAATRVWRGMAMPGRRALVVRDEVELHAPADAWWFFHTEAAVNLAADGHTATLARHGARLRVRLLVPDGARFECRDARPLPASPQPPKQNPNDGILTLAVHLPAAASTTLAMLFEPDDAVAAPPPPCAGEPLTGWGDALPPLPAAAAEVRHP